MRIATACLLSCLVFLAPLSFATEWPLQHLAEPGLAGLPHHGHADPADEPPPADGEAGGEQDQEEEWDVNDPPGEEEIVDLDTREGTWMNLDVSPDGQRIVFDLLGDLYLLPIDGGSAEALTSGLAWDMQPRFSPDGSAIAYTSDAGGGDNVWIMDLESRATTQVTKESFRLLNNPEWSPDGEYIAARKHFTGRRSLGAGELWLYHRTGGDGLQMTEKPNDQKDLGEPAFSPDGRFIYYSYDATAGSTFQYNKNPHTEIYRIARLDRTTGEIEDFVTGPGGAVRPTPSPDGKHLAFVRRVGYQTSLQAIDLASGAIRTLYVGLDRDNQETWAVHGVYANFDWTPDSGAIVFWSGGKIHRIDVSSSEVVEIPFHVQQPMTISPAVRFAYDPAPESFETKMLRWVQVSPTGEQVLFQSLGQLWLQPIRDGKAGKARRLTSQDEHWELYPSFSADGKSVVYVTWSDADLGSVRVVDAIAGSKGKVLTNQPGHYVEPAISPDGATVVYRKIRGGFLSKDLFGRELGLYQVAVEGSGSEPERIAESGIRPHFGGDSTRVFFMTFGEKNSRALESVGLVGSPRQRAARKHFSSEAALEWRVSPDGEWVAFTERFKVFVAPFARSGRLIKLGPKTSSLPVHQVSQAAGEYLHWSGDSQSINWAMGRTLSTRQLDDAFAYLNPEASGEDGEPAEDETESAEPQVAEIELGMRVDSVSGRGLVALVGARVITIDSSDRVLEDATLIVEDDRIIELGPSEEVAVPKDAFVVDVSGKTIMPGIVDVHWHGAQGFSEIIPQQNWFHYSNLTFGVTTIHDPSTDTSTFFAAAEMARAGLITAPRLFSTGTILYGADSAGATAKVESLEDARFHLERMKAVGAFSVKSYNQPRRDQRQQILAAARELEMLVVPEGGSLYMHNMTMVVDGHTGIEHAIPLAKLYGDVVQLWSATEVGYTPTLTVGYGGIWGENYWYAHTDVWNHERLLSFVPRKFVEPTARRPFKAPLEEYNHIRVAESAKTLTDAGVKVNVGAHGQREGLGSHWETWMLVQGGMSEMEALRAATWNGALYIGMEKDLGSLEKGKLADLVVLDANPLEDIRNSEFVSHVMIGGRLYEASTMNEIGNTPRDRQPFFWQ